MSLSIDDVKDLKTYLKGVEKQLNKFSIDKDSLEKYAKEEMKKQEELEKEKEKKKRLDMKAKYKPRENHIDELIEELFGSINNTFEGDDYFGWQYDLSCFLRDEHPLKCLEWQKKLEHFQHEMKEEIMELLNYNELNHPEQKASEE